MDDLFEKPARDVRVYTVGEITRLVKATLEDEIGQVCVEGEISNFRRQSSGHCYFTLKDDRAQLAAVLFAGEQRRNMPSLADGQLVRARGELTVYEARGQYQLIVRQIEAAGAGALMLRFEALKRKLEAEGLFDAARKRPLPLLPRHVGIVTSPSGAALRDMLIVFARRFPNLHILIAPVRVQGAGAAEEIAAAVDRLNALSAASGAPGQPLNAPLDVIIVGRGGGSIEDLWCFNEEIVARAIARSDVPVISAVGHETDFTISDFTADVRAPTPSAAAEQVVGCKEHFEEFLRVRDRTLRQIMRQRLSDLRGRFAVVRGSHVFHEPRHMLERAAQRVDTLELRLRQLRSQRLQSVRARIETLRLRLAHGVERGMTHRRQRLETRAGQLRALSPAAVLERGFSLKRTADGKLVRSVRQLAPGAHVRTQVADGTFESTITIGGNEPPVFDFGGTEHGEKR